jgi:hypothetical protein
MSEGSAEQLFPIQPYDFETGTCADGRQVVMGLLCPHLVAYFFDPQGNLLRREQRLWNKPAPRFGTDGPFKIHDEEFRSALERQEREWQAELGFTPGTIWVKQFLDGTPVGIELLPDHYQDLENADWLDEEEKQELMESRAEWLERGSFVWWWAKDYYMSKDGKVEST